MAAPSNLDWLYHLAGWTLAAAGLALLLWSLFWDRSRGRRRCPKCWYDMSGVPGLMCPECGRLWRSERALQRTRRRWRRAGAASIVLALGGSAMTVPRVRCDGWWSIVPNVVVIARLPRAGEEWRWDQVQNAGVENPFSQEMERRFANNQIRDWELAWALERVGVLRTRRRWASDENVRVGVWPPRWLDGHITADPQGEGLQPIVQKTGMSMSGTFHHVYEAAQRDQGLGRPSVGTREVVFNLAIRPRLLFAIRRSPATDRDVQVRVPMSIVPPGMDEFRPTSDPSVDTAARQAISVNVSTYNGSGGPTAERMLSVHVDRRQLPQLDGIALGVVVDLIRDESVVTTIRFQQITRARFEEGPIRGVETVPDFDTRRFDRADTPRWTIRVRGDRAASIREFDCERYWAGQFTIPLSDVLTR